MTTNSHCFGSSIRNFKIEYDVETNKWKLYNFSDSFHFSKEKEKAFVAEFDSYKLAETRIKELEDKNLAELKNDAKVVYVREGISYKKIKLTHVGDGIFINSDTQEKVYANKVFKYDKNNVILLKQIEAIESEISKLEKEVRHLHTCMAPIYDKNT